MVRETAHLIASDKVEGTPVRRSDGDRIGTIERVMIDKRSGKVAYAVMTFGGFLGIGEEYRALPWSVLRYNEDLDAYELNLMDEQLRVRPGQRNPAFAKPAGSIAMGSVAFTITTARHGTGKPGADNRRSAIRRSAELRYQRLAASVAVTR
jgi:hypothetical protein